MNFCFSAVDLHSKCMCCVFMPMCKMYMCVHVSVYVCAVCDVSIDICDECDVCDVSVVCVCDVSVWCMGIQKCLCSTCHCVGTNGIACVHLEYH